MQIFNIRVFFLCLEIATRVKIKEIGSSRQDDCKIII